MTSTASPLTLILQFMLTEQDVDIWIANLPHGHGHHVFCRQLAESAAGGLMRIVHARLVYYDS